MLLGWEALCGAAGASRVMHEPSTANTDKAAKKKGNHKMELIFSSRGKKSPRAARKSRAEKAIGEHDFFLCNEHSAGLI